jgi:hypothetical protein
MGGSNKSYRIQFAENFIWRGWLSKEDFDALREMLHTYRTITLQALNIDLLDLWDAQWNWFANDYDQQLWIKDHNFFGEIVLGLAPGSTQVLFLSIKSLSFSSVQFQDASLEIAHALDISRLHHLNLRNCRHTGPLFRKIVESAKPLNLRSLELVIPHHSDNSYAKEVDEDWIKPFLSSFEGLNSLNLLVFKWGRPKTISRYWPSIFHHQETLARLVYHEIHTKFWVD